MYTVHICNDNHEWRSKSSEESEIIALKAEVGQLKGNLQLAGKIMKKYESTTLSGNTNLFNKNKKKKFKVDNDFITMKKSPPKDDEPHERMFGHKDHPLFKKSKVHN